jgi:hypothetical protein
MTVAARASRKIRSTPTSLRNAAPPHTRMADSVMASAIREQREPQRICDYLITAANGNGGADNITVVVVEVADRWWRRLMERRRRPAGRGEDVEAYAAV